MRFGKSSDEYIKTSGIIVWVDYLIYISRDVELLFLSSSLFCVSLLFCLVFVY